MEKSIIKKEKSRDLRNHVFTPLYKPVVSPRVSCVDPSKRGLQRPSVLCKGLKAVTSGNPTYLGEMKIKTYS